MAGDIFGYTRNPRPQAVFSSDNAALTINGTGTAYMVQQWNINYQQTVQELFELGSSNLYWVKGQPQGQGNIAKVMGGSSSHSSLFPAGAFDLCDGGATINLKATAGRCDTAAGQAAQVNLSMDGAVVVGVGYQSSVQDMMVHENFSWRFAKLVVS